MTPEIVVPVAAVVAKYTAAEVITILAAVGVLVGSVVTGVVTIIGTLRNGQKTDTLIRGVIGDGQTPGLKQQVEQVHTVVNSNLAAVKAELTMANSRIESLVGAIRDLKGERDKLAERAERAAPAAAPASAGITAATMTVNEMNVEELNAPPKEKK